MSAATAITPSRLNHEVRHWLNAFDGSLSDHIGNVIAAVRTVLDSPSLAELDRQAEAGMSLGPSLRKLSREASELFDKATVAGFGDRPAIAVLPFVTLSNDPDQEYFANGISEELITRLSAWRDFPVIARNSSFTRSTWMRCCRQANWMQHHQEPCPCGCSKAGRFVCRLMKRMKPNTG